VRLYSLKDKITEYHEGNPNSKIKEWGIHTNALVTNELVDEKHDYSPNKNSSCII